MSKLTRVQKINQAIEILYLQKEMTPVEIHRYLKERNIDIDIEVICAQTAPLVSVNFNTSLKPRHSYFDAYNAILKNITEYLFDNDLPMRYMLTTWNSYGLILPGSLSKKTTMIMMRSYLMRHGLLRKSNRRNAHNYKYTWKEFVDHVHPWINQLLELTEKEDKERHMRKFNAVLEE